MRWEKETRFVTHSNQLTVAKMRSDEGQLVLKISDLIPKTDVTEKIQLGKHRSLVETIDERVSLGIPSFRRASSN